MQKIEINQSTNRKIKVQTTIAILFPNNIFAKNRNKFKERSYLTFYYVHARIKDKKCTKLFYQLSLRFICN